MAKEDEVKLLYLLDRSVYTICFVLFNFCADTFCSPTVKYLLNATSPSTSSVTIVSNCLYTCLCTWLIVFFAC